MKVPFLLTILLLALAYSGCKTKEPTTEVEKLGSFDLPYEVDDNSFMMRMEREALREPFKGVFASTGEDIGLFPIRSTRVSTEPIVDAAEAFVKALSTEQQSKTVFKVEDDAWRKWSNVDNGIFAREGISLMEMDQGQRHLAMDLMRVSLSARGLQLSKDIMKTDQTLKELNDGAPFLDEELYFFTIMGQPSATEPWGWQIDGHHLVINYFVLGDQVVMTPTFMGGEPIITTSGKYKGNTIFQDEQNLGLKFMNSLTAVQQTTATLSSDKKGHNARAEAYSDNVTIDYEGIRADLLSATQKESLLDLVDQYVSNLREGHASIRMEEVEGHLDETYFAWIGLTDEDAVFYYRIHSPVILIEFDHQAAVGAPSDIRGATRNHIHTVVRTPNGNDYGRDLLRQHLEEHHH